MKIKIIARRNGDLKVENDLECYTVENGTVCCRNYDAANCEIIVDNEASYSKCEVREDWESECKKLQGEMRSRLDEAQFKYSLSLKEMEESVKELQKENEIMKAKLEVINLIFGK